MNEFDINDLVNFAHNQMCDNDAKRNRIYDHLRERFKQPKATLPELRRISENPEMEDDYAIKLLDFAQHLEKARVEIIRAALRLQKC